MNANNSEWQLFFDNRSGEKALPGAADILRWVQVVPNPRKTASEISVSFVDEFEGAELNRQYRQTDKPTNVLAFPNIEEPLSAEQPHLLGDIVICMPVAQAEAQTQEKTLTAHLAHLVIHGLYHLLGHDHADETEAQAMEALEAKALAQLGFANPYEEHHVG